MIENPFATPKRGGEVMLIENPFIAPIKRDGKLTPERWYALHLLIGRINALEHDAIITAFCEVYGLSRRHLKARNQGLPPRFAADVAVRATTDGRQSAKDKAVR